MDERHQGMIDELLDHDDQADGRAMTAWECEFVESLSRWRGELSEKQATRLAELWGKIFDG